MFIFSMYYDSTKLQIHLTISNFLLRCIIDISKITRSETLRTVLNTASLILAPILLNSITLLVAQARNQSHP